MENINATTDQDQDTANQLARRAAFGFGPFSAIARNLGLVPRNNPAVATAPIAPAGQQNPMPDERAGLAPVYRPRAIRSTVPIAGRTVRAATAPKPSTLVPIAPELPPRPQYQAPKKLAGWKNVLGNIAQDVVGTISPLAGEQIGRVATNAGRQEAAQRKFQEEENRWRENAQDVAATTPAPAKAPKKIDSYINGDGNRVDVLESSDGNITEHVGGKVQGKAKTLPTLQQLYTGASQKLAQAEASGDPTAIAQATKMVNFYQGRILALHPQKPDQSAYAAWKKTHPNGTPMQYLAEREDIIHREAAKYRTGGAKGTTLEQAGTHRATAANQKDEIEKQIAALNQEAETHVTSGDVGRTDPKTGKWKPGPGDTDGGGWSPAMKAELAALRDRYKTASEAYDHWDEIYSRLSGTPITGTPTEEGTSTQAPETPAAVPKQAKEAQTRVVNGVTLNFDGQGVAHYGTHEFHLLPDGRIQMKK